MEIELTWQVMFSGWPNLADLLHLLIRVGHPGFPVQVRLSSDVACEWKSQDDEGRGVASRYVQGW